MSKRNLIITAIIVVLLAFVSQWFGRSKNSVKDEKVGKTLLSADKVEKFNQLILRDKDGMLTIKKVGDQWVIPEKQDYPADAKHLLELMDKLTGNTISSLVTKDKSRLKHFQVVYWDEDGASAQTSGTELVMSEDGQTVFKMISGKARESKAERADMPSHPDGVYVRVGDDTNIYLLKDNLNLKTDALDWIQTSLLYQDKKEVKSIRFEVSKDRFNLARPEKGKEMELESLKTGQKTANFERSNVLSDLEDFKIEEPVSRSEVKEQSLALEALITVSFYDSPDLAFKILTETTKKSSKDSEAEKTYYVSFVKPDDSKALEKWKSLYQLNDQWIFRMEDWKAKRWVKVRKDFIEN